MRARVPARLGQAQRIVFRRATQWHRPDRVARDAVGVIGDTSGDHHRVAAGRQFHAILVLHDRTRPITIHVVDSGVVALRLPQEQLARCQVLAWRALLVLRHEDAALGVIGLGLRARWQRRQDPKHPATSIAAVTGMTSPAACRT
jgi:hypothetical protein